VRDVTVPLFGAAAASSSTSTDTAEDDDATSSNSSSTQNPHAPNKKSATDADESKNNNNNKNDSDSDDDNSKNLFDWFIDSSLLPSIHTLEELLDDPLRLARRECYYLYYEIHPTGQHTQQIFCRGTTLGVDVLTCLQAWTVYDAELQCRVHQGFRNQADRVVADVVPLLAPPTDQRSTISLAGHSLGGAVAVLVAAKLKRRGYDNIVSLTTIGQPACVPTERDAHQLRTLLPMHNYWRVENDRDFVPYLPPLAVHVGDKLWFPNYSSCSISSTIRSLVSSLWAGTQSSSSSPPPPRFVVDAPDHAWTDSAWINFCVPEILTANGKPHRIPSYLERLDAMVTTTTKTDKEKQASNG